MMRGHCCLVTAQYDEGVSGLPRFEWIVNHTGLPQNGTHLVGLTRQYCVLNKQENFRSAVSLSPATQQASLPVVRSISVHDKLRSGRAGFPAAITFGGISDETTLPAPITLPAPMRTPFNTMELVPMKTLSSITIG